MSSCLRKIKQTLQKYKANLLKKQALVIPHHTFPLPSHAALDALLPGCWSDAGRRPPVPRYRRQRARPSLDTVTARRQKK
ncbi:hypothetical protein, partial [Janthinobacterium sp. BJB401]|uniref:hypothetical protein n=1 Tax=Janthinobacterium sp. BJB401 TaxID=2745934 RepID=UPI001C3C229C